MTMKQPLTPDITLSTGTTCSHAYMDNGAQMVTTDTPEETFTNEEWIEYCEIVRLGNISDEIGICDFNAGEFYK